MNSIRPTRIAVGQLSQESNTFSPVATTLESFESALLLRGEQLLSGYGNARVEVPGFLDVLRHVGFEVVPLIAANALAGGPVTRGAFEALMHEMEARLAGAGAIDGVLLALHGAMCVEDQPDADGEIIERVAASLPAGTPIGVSLDLHAHVTRRMFPSNVFATGYREYPHIDMYETGERVAKTMFNTLRRTIRPRMALAKRPLIVSPSKARTADEPLRSIIAVARQMEAEGEILDASFFPVQPWLDVPDLGFGVLVCADGDQSHARAIAERLADLVWNRRHEFEPELVPLEEAIDIGLREPGITVVADSGDAPSGGSAADSAGVLKALLEAQADRAARLTYVTICDAEAARECALAGVGRKLTLNVGHKVSGQDGSPLRIQCQVISVSDGSFVMLDAGARGMRMEFGLTAVVAIGSIRLAIRSLPGFEWDTGIYTAFGLRVEEASLVFVKSPSHFRTAFGRYASRILLAETPGPTCPNMRRLTFHQATRPLFPIDEDAEARAM